MIVIGVDHRRLPMPAIARIGRALPALWDVLLASEGVRGAVLLRTCARLEAYVDASQFHRARRAVTEAFIDVAGEDAVAVENALVVRRGKEAIEHLFRVAAGLESTVIGDTEVVGQMRHALRDARERGASTRTLDMAWEQALRVSRSARVHLEPASVVSTALALAPSAPRIALVIGSGAFARVCVDHLASAGAHTVYAFSASGRQLPGAAALASSELPDALAIADVVVTASGRGVPVVTAPVMTSALSRRAAPITVLDLAPGDLDPAIAEFPDVHMIGLDAVTGSSISTAAAADVVASAAADILPRIASRELDDVIVGLRTHVESIAEQVGDGRSDEALRRFASSLLHQPTVRARQAARDGELDRFAAALETLFGVQVGSPA